MKSLFRCIVILVLFCSISIQVYSYEPNPVPSYYTHEEFVNVAHIYLKIAENTEEADLNEMLKAFMFRGYIRGTIEGYGESNVDGIPEHMAKLTTLYNFKTIVYEIAKTVVEFRDNPNMKSLSPRENIFIALMSFNLE